MLNPHSLSEDILYAVGNASGTFDIYPERPLNSSELAAVRTDIASMTYQEAIKHYCTWHGILGWSSRLTSVVEALKKAEQAAFTPGLKLPNVTHYTTVEGGIWLPWIKGQKHLAFALKFDNGMAWDTVSGWRVVL